MSGGGDASIRGEVPIWDPWRYQFGTPGGTNLGPPEVPIWDPREGYQFEHMGGYYQYIKVEDIGSLVSR